MTKTQTAIVSRQGTFGSPQTAIQTQDIATESGALSNVAREEAEIKAAFTLARMNRRDEVACYERIMKSCERPTFAEGAQYRFPRGGKDVTGPSVGLAREMARCWGNIRSGVRFVSIDDDFVHIKGYALDLETNTLSELEDKFAKRIQRKNRASGVTEWVHPDERDLRELTNRRGAILERNSILKAMPTDIVEDALRICADTMRRAAAGELEQNPEQAIRSMVAAFGQLQVTTDMLTKYVGHELRLVNADELAELRQIYASIRDGNSKREDYFDFGSGTTPAQPSAKTAALNEKLKGRSSAGSDVGAGAGQDQALTGSQSSDADSEVSSSVGGTDTSEGASNDAEAPVPTADYSEWITELYERLIHEGMEVDEFKRIKSAFLVGKALVGKEDKMTPAQRDELKALLESPQAKKPAARPRKQ